MGKVKLIFGPNAHRPGLANTAGWSPLILIYENLLPEQSNVVITETRHVRYGDIQPSQRVKGTNTKNRSTVTRNDGKLLTVHSKNNRVMGH